MLYIIKDIMFEEILVVDMHCHQCPMTTHSWMDCYNITGEPDEDDPLEKNIPDS